MTASFHHDGSLGPYSLFNMTASFHHDGSLGPYNLSDFKVPNLPISFTTIIKVEIEKLCNIMNTNTLS
jgi:hypothetical protein